MDCGFQFSIHPFFVSIFNEFHLIPSEINPNAWENALYYMYDLSNKIPFPIDFFSCVIEMHELT